MSSKRFLPILALAGLAVGARAAEAPAPETEAWSARFQTTYVGQAKPPFSAAYSGPDSLGPERERSYTFTATAYLGFRPWRDGEIYLDAEVGQGVPFSNLAGLGGFTNGEISRVAGSNPKAYRQRLFLRQTWNLGGERQPVESDFNQLAGSVDSRRVVLTVGNFSVLDVFDDNAYAKDPRRQFMNWGNMTYAAFDYAADARGYGWGFAAEWYDGDWVLRLGRMTPPRDPNMLPLDFRIAAHYGDQVEVEHDHRIAGLPGKVRLLAWRDRARLASFADALAYGRAHPGADGGEYILAVRNGDKTKYGVGINVEQALSATAGVFLRAMAADGRSETLAFTEVDDSLAVGASFQGAAWGRAGDTIGISLLANGLSRDRRRYLEAGGISFFIGDGALRYRPETLFETYYSLGLPKKWWLAADYQGIRNPAYNADRGPVSVWSLRIHGEF